MKVKLLKRGLPTSFDGLIGRSLVGEADLWITRHGRLRAKLLVFKSCTAMASFWKKTLGRKLGFGVWGKGTALGAVSGLAYEQKKIYKDGSESLPTMVCDPRYFCIIGLVKGHLTMEIICHEAMHAGFAYAKRRGGDMWKSRHTMDEEDVCYPAGAVANQIVRFLKSKDLWNV